MRSLSIFFYLGTQMNPNCSGDGWLLDATTTDSNRSKTDTERIYLVVKTLFTLC